MSVLVILGASITALAVARDAHCHGLQPVIVDQADGPAFHCRWVTPVRVSAIAEPATLRSIIDVGLGVPDAALISTADHWTRFVIEHRSTLTSSFRAILQASNATLEICLDKLAFSEWCVASGLPTPLSWVPTLSPRPAALAFPLLLRPVRTVHNSPMLGLPKAVEARDEAELADWLRQYDAKGVVPLVSESLLNRPLEQYSVPFARSRERILLFTARKVRPEAALCQTGTFVQMCVDDRIERLARSTIARLDYFGIGEIEILRDCKSDTDYLIEINARPWLQYALAPASGHDFLSLILGRRVGTKAPLREGRMWLNLHDDLFVAFSRSIGIVRHGRLGVLGYLQSLMRANVFALFDWRDPRPFLMSLRRRP
ncbi:MAG: hypothetical protein ABJA83_13280 [Burkholderiaceae bacterium]